MPELPDVEMMGRYVASTTPQRRIDISWVCGVPDRARGVSRTVRNRVGQRATDVCSAIRNASVEGRKWT